MAETLHGATEGTYLDLGGLKYQVQISRLLNPSSIEDRAYLVGLNTGRGDARVDLVGDVVLGTRRGRDRCAFDGYANGRSGARRQQCQSRQHAILPAFSGYQDSASGMPGNNSLIRYNVT